MFCITILTTGFLVRRLLALPKSSSLEYIQSKCACIIGLLDICISFGSPPPTLFMLCLKLLTRSLDDLFVPQNNDKYGYLNRDLAPLVLLNLKMKLTLKFLCSNR